MCAGKIAALFPPDSHHKVRGAAIFPGADCPQSSTIPPWPMCVTIQGPPWLSNFISQQIGQNSESLAKIQLVDIV